MKNYDLERPYLSKERIIKRYIVLGFKLRVSLGIGL